MYGGWHVDLFDGKGFQWTIMANVWAANSQHINGSKLSTIAHAATQDYWDSDPPPTSFAGTSSSHFLLALDE